MLLPWEQRLYFSTSLASCGCVTTFWPMQYRRKCVRLMGSLLKERISTFLHFLPLLHNRVASAGCRADGWNFSIHVGSWGGGHVTWCGCHCAFWELLFCLVNAEDCFYVNSRRDSGPSSGHLQAVSPKPICLNLYSRYLCMNSLSFYYQSHCFLSFLILLPPGISSFFSLF